MKWGMLLGCTLLLTACASKAALQDAEVRASEAQSNAAGLQSKLSASDAALEQAQATATSLLATNAQLEANLTQARTDYSRATNQVNQLSDQVGKYLCDSQITDMKYDNVMDASTILAAWWARQPGVESVGTPYRDKIWSNALSQLHAIRFTSSEDHQQYVEHFMVFFDEIGMTPAVFWIGGQCWLDPP